jgi:hypothetical protein
MTHPRHTRIMMLAQEALCADWFPEGTIARHVRAHETSTVTPEHITTALRELRRRGHAESCAMPGYRERHWRRVPAGKAA